MLSILNVAYPFAPVDADPVGGAEQVLGAIDRALVTAGHRSTVVAHADSAVAGDLVPVTASLERIDEAARATVRLEVRRAVERRLAAGGIDVVHLHGIDFLDYLPESPVPVVVTLHLPLGWYPRQAVVPDDRFGRVCVSRSQRRALHGLGVTPAEAERLAIVENGVSLELYRPRGDKRDFALALGRICPEKGFDVSLRAARAAGRPLVLAGRAFGYEAHERHFRDEIVPLLDDERRFVGPVGGESKRALLAGARCLLVSSRVDETSSLVAMEALASGTPVVAFRRGALPEIIEHGRTGFLVDSEAEMAEAIARVGELRSEDCRAAAEARFSSEAMARRYFELYAGVAGERRARGRGQPKLEVEEVRDEAGLTALAPEWGALCDGSPLATPFQRPEWLLPAQRYLAPDASPNVLAIRRAGQLVGVLPLAGRGDSLVWMGAGVSDYLDLVCQAGAEAEVAQAALLHLDLRGGAWSRLEWDALRADSPLVSCHLPARWQEEREAADPSPVSLLPPPATPGKLDYTRRRLEREGAVGWRTATQADAGDRVRALVTLHGARWRARGEAGVLADESVQRFHAEAAVGLARAGVLRLYLLELDGRAVGSLYGFAGPRRFYYYLSGFDPAFARLSPGVLLVDHAMRAAAKEGATEFDFLRGCEPYKYTWGAVDRPAWKRRIRRG